MTRRRPFESVARTETASTRRTFLRRGLFTSVGVASTTAGCNALRDDPSGETPTDESWEAEADRRIADHRKTDLAVDVRGPLGIPIPNATVTVRMIDHEFKFGTSVAARHLVEETSPGDPYREHLRTLFNTGVVEHRNKWKPWENRSERAFALSATEWLLEQGLALRGHAAIWQRFGLGVVPDDVKRKVRSDDDDRGQYVARRAREHVEEIVGHYRGTVEEWDVCNEQIGAHRLTDVIDPGAPAERAPEVARWFELAREADPDATLFVNEYNVLAGEYDEHRNAYAELVDFLLGSDADLGGVGMQSHHDGRKEARTPDELLATLEQFTHDGVALEVTEYDTYGDGWTEENEATYLRTFLKTVFSHPAVEGFLMWGFWDGAHWQDRAPLFRADWSPKPALDVYRSLVFEDWWTDETGRTGLSGSFETDAFLGTYEITAEARGVSRTTRVAATESTTPVRTTVTLPLF